MILAPSLGGYCRNELHPLAQVIDPELETNVRGRILAVLKTSPKPLSKDEVAIMADVALPTCKTMLHRLIQSGDVQGKRILGAGLGYQYWIKHSAERP